MNGFTHSDINFVCIITAMIPHFLPCILSICWHLISTDSLLLCCTTTLYSTVQVFDEHIRVRRILLSCNFICSVEFFLKSLITFLSYSYAHTSVFLDNLKSISITRLTPSKPMSHYVTLASHPLNLCHTVTG